MNDLVFLFSADSDIQAAYEFYETSQQRRGEVFMLHLDLALGRLRAFPEVGPIFHGAHRRLLVTGFPFGIFYTLEGRRIIVSGVMDLRQNPKAHPSATWEVTSPASHQHSPPSASQQGAGPALPFTLAEAQSPPNHPAIPRRPMILEPVESCFAEIRPRISQSAG